MLIPLNSFATAHSNSLKRAHPFALIGDDYGILNLDDLAINACIAVPQPFAEESIFFPYWQCFETKNVAFECDHGGIQEPGTPIEALMVFVVRSQKKSEYLAPSLMDLAACNEYKKDWERLTKGEKHVCFSAELVDLGKDGEHDAHWIFDKFKTRKGCVSYFEGYCDIRNKYSPCARRVGK